MKSLWIRVAILAGLLLGSITWARGHQGREGASAPAAAPTDFLYRIQPTRVEMLTKGPTAEENAAIEAHRNYLKELTRQGVVVLGGRTMNNDETTFGIIIFHAPTEDAAREIMNGDPAVQKGVFHAELFPFAIVFMEGRPLP